MTGRRGTSPQMKGRYPGFDVLAPSVVEHWDEPTRRVVLGRLEPRRRFRFFRPDEVPTLRAFCDVVLDQDAEPRVPVPELIDDKYAHGRLDGFRYASMPDDRETWHLALAGLDHTAGERCRARFAELDRDAQRGIVEDLRRGALDGGPWACLDRSLVFSVLMRAAVTEFYAHPWAWNEIGFGGPAYPRGFMRFGDLATRERYEAGEST